MTTRFDDSSSEAFDREAAAADGAAEHAERVAGGQGRFAEFVAAVRTLVDLLRAYRAGEFELSWKEVTLVLSSLIYVVIPVDALPEAMLGPAGLPDDVAVVLSAVGALAVVIRRFRAQRPA